MAILAITDRRRPWPRGPLLTLVLSAAMLLTSAAPAVASTRTEEQQGAALAADVQSGAKKCADLSATDFERIGEYVMRRMLGSAQAHDAMNRQMASMMGTSGEERAHVFLGRRFAGCAGGAAPASFGAMMGMMGSYGAGPMGTSGGRYDPGMMGGNTAGYGPGMIGRNAQSDSGGGSSARDDDWNGADTVMTVLMAVLVIAALIALARWRPWRRPPDDSPLDVLRRRYAAGEIDSDEFERRRGALGGTA